MATEVVNFLPSEIARLVLGYLSEEGYLNSYKCFIKECPHLNEYLTLKRRGQTYPLHVNGLTLCQTLQEYAHFKLADTQRRQMMGVTAMWSQLDAVVRTLKEHTACKQNLRVNGLTQSSRVRRLIKDKKRQRQSEKLQNKRDLCKRTSATAKYVAAARIDSEAEKEMDVTESDVSEGEVEPPETGNCGVLTPPTDTEAKGLSGRSRKIQEDYRRRRETDNRETEFILHSAPPSVSSHHKHSTFQRSSSISNLLNISSQRLQKLQGTAFSRTEQNSTKETSMETCLQNVIEGNPKDKNGAIQCISGVSRLERGVEGSSQGVAKVGIQEGVTVGEEVGGSNCDNTISVQPNDCDGGPVNMTVDNQISESATSVQMEKGNMRDSVSRSVNKKQTNRQALVNSRDVSSPKPSSLQDDISNSEQVLQVVLSVLPAIENLQSSLKQPPASSEDEVKGQGEIGQDDVPPISSSENSQESAESGPSIKTLGFQQAVSPSDTERGVGPPGTPVKQVDEASQMSMGRTPRRKRLLRQKHQRKGSATLNDSNKTEENSLLMENITLFLNEFLNNPSLHERLAENINRTLNIKTTEKRIRKKSGKAPKIQENPKPNKPEKPEGSTIPEESESNYSQNLESQGLYTFLDDILNINETQMTETQIGGIIELTSKDPNFESLFNLFQEPHSASETQKTDFSGIRLEMGKEASINNSSLPSFTDCPDPSNTTSEENLIMEILQSPQPVPSQGSSYPPEMLDQTAQSHASEKATPSSDMDWNSGPPNNQSSSNPTARNIFESFQQISGHPDSSVKTLDLHKSPQREQTEWTKSKEVNGVELECLPAKSVPTNNCQQLPAGGDGIVCSEQQTNCQSVLSLSLASSSSGTMARSSPGPVLSLINSIRSPSVQQDLNQVRSPLSSENNVPCQSPQEKTINAKVQEGISATSPHPYTKLTDKVSVSGDIPINRISVVHSPVQKAIFTNQPLSPLQVCVTKPVQQSPRLSSPNSGPLTPCSVQEKRVSVCSPNVFVGQSSKMSASSPFPITSVQATDSASESVLPISDEQRSRNCELKSLKIASPLHVKEMETGHDSSSKNTPGTSSLTKSEKPQKKKNKSTSKKEKGKSGKVSSKSLEKQSDPDLVETFETSVTEDLGFPVISIKSVMKSPQEVSVPQKDKNLRKVNDSECQQMSYKSFIRGVTGEECSTPMTERAGPKASPHTSQSSANSNEMLSEMIGLVSSLEKSQHRNSSSEKSSADFDKGKRNNSKTRKDKKNDEADSSPPSKKLQWSPDLKALLKLVTPEKKGKSKGKKSKKATASAEKRRNPSRKVRRSNEENIRKDEPETGASSISVQKNQPLENTTKDIPNTVSDVTGKVVDINTSALSMPTINTFMSPVQTKSFENNSGAVIIEKKSNVSEEVGLTPKTVLTAVSALKDNGKNSRKSLSLPQNTAQESIHILKETSTLQAPNTSNSQVLAEPITRLETLSSEEFNQVPPAVNEEKKEKASSSVGTDYNKILYSPNRDFLDSPPRYESPGIAVSRGGHYQGNISTTCTGQFDSPCEPILYSSQIITPSVYVLNESTSQPNSIVVSDSHLNVVYSSGMSYTQNSVSYQGQVMNSGDQAVNYSTVYIDSNGIVQASSNSTGQNIVPVSSTTPDVTPTPVTDILSAAAAVIHTSPLQTVDSYQLNSTPETQRKDKQESVGQLLAYPVGRYYPEKKLHVRSLNFGPEAGSTEIRKPGYGRGHKKKNYVHIPSPVKPGGLVKKQAKGKAKSKGDIKGKAKTDNGIKEVASIDDSAPKVVVQKKDNLTSNPASKMADEADDFIPDASGSVYILEGNTRKKIKLHKTPRPTKTVLPYFLPNQYELSQGIIPLRPELFKKSENLTPSSSLLVPDQSSILEEKCNLDRDSDSEVDVDGDCDLPDLSPEAPRKETPKSKCLEMVQQADLTTPVKSSSSGNAALYNTTKYMTQPSSVQSISDSCESFLDRQLTSAPKSVTFNEGTDSKGSDSPSVGNTSTFPTRPTSSFSNNSNSLPDLHSPSPLINMSTPPKKRITASLKHGGGCYFFSSSSQEGKSQAKGESKESEMPNGVPRVPHSPRTPKGKQTPNKPLRQSPRFFGSPSRRLHSMTTPTKSGTQETLSNNNKGVKRLREMNSGENNKAERKSKKARNGKRAVDLSKVDFEKFLDKIHKM